MKSAFAPIQVRKGGGTFGHFTQLSRARISLGTKISSTFPHIIIQLISFCSHKEINQRNYKCFAQWYFTPLGFDHSKHFRDVDKQKTYFILLKVLRLYWRIPWSIMLITVQKQWDYFSNRKFKFDHLVRRRVKITVQKAIRLLYQIW